MTRKHAPPRQGRQADGPRASREAAADGIAGITWPRPPARPTHATRLLLRPAAFVKLLYLTHLASTEIGGFGISAEHDALVVEEFVLVRQRTTEVTVEFEDEAVADHVDRFAGTGVPPGRSARVWIHSHPGTSAAPSSTDEATFARAFGGCDWSAMAIVSRAQETYCRLQFTAGPGGRMVVPVVLDWASLPEWLAAVNVDALVVAWREELATLVQRETWPPASEPFLPRHGPGVRRGMWFDDVAGDRDVAIDQDVGGAVEADDDRPLDPDAYTGLTDEEMAYLAWFERAQEGGFDEDVRH